MTIFELIAGLTTIAAEHGDLPVCTRARDEYLTTPKLAVETAAEADIISCGYDWDSPIAAGQKYLEI